MSDITLDKIRSGYNLSKINNNFEEIEDVINEEVVHTTGGNNTMQQDLDMNSNQILNLPAPINPTDVIRLEDLKGLIDSNDKGIVTVKYKPDNIAEGQKIFTMPQDFDSVAVFIDGLNQNELDGAFTVSGRDISLSESIPTNSSLEFWLGVFPVGINTGDPKGSRGNPYVFGTTVELTNAYETLKVGDWVETRGDLTELDGRNATYYVVDNTSAGLPDNYFILNLTDKKGVLMYSAPTAASNNTKLLPAKGYWGKNTHPVVNSQSVGNETIKATAYINGTDYILDVKTGENEKRYTLGSYESVSDYQSPAIEFDSSGYLSAFYAKDKTLYANQIKNGSVQPTTSVELIEEVRDIQVHRVHKSVYVFITTSNNGIWCVNYKDNLLGTPVKVSDFGTMVSKSLYKEDNDKTAAPTVKVLLSDVPGTGVDKVYFVVGTYTPTANGVGSLVFKESDGTVVSTLTPNTIDTVIDSTNAELVFTAQASHTVCLGDVSREEAHLGVIAEMPLVSGSETFNTGYAYNLTLLYKDTSSWVSEITDSVIGLEGFDAFATQLSSGGSPTGSYGVEGIGYNPLGLRFADLPTYEKVDQLVDQRKIVFVTHAGDTYDLRTKTVTTDRFISGTNLLASDNVRVISRDNNKPISRPRSVQNSDNVTVAYLDVDSYLPIEEAINTVSDIDTKADVQSLREDSKPSSLLTVEEAADLVSDGSIGSSGGSWWTYPTTIGREENGKDVVYVGGVYGVTDNSRNDGLAIKGTSVQFVASLTYDGSSYTLDKKKLFDKYIVDEHNNPAINFQKANGELLIACNSHADSTDEVQESTIYNFGKNLDTLSEANVIYHRSRSTYAQLLSTHFTSWQVQRMNGAGWGFTRFTQNGFPIEYSQMFTTTHNYYLSFAEIDKERTQGAGAANKYHCFCAANPIDDEKADIRYLKGEFEVGSGIALRDSSGALKLTMSGGSTPITDTDFDTAVSEDPATRRVRLLDIAYRDEPRILYQSMPKSNDLVNRSYVTGQRIEVKDIEFTDLKMAWWNGASWSNVTVKANIQGGLGWDPLGDTDGVTYNANAYFYGACFNAGSDHTTSTDVIYFVWKNPDDTYEIRSIDFNPTTGVVSNEQVVVPATRKILYRPKMVQGGNRRVLFYYEADDWWSYTTYTAVTRFVDLT